jgi:hypothetical protein
MDGGAKAQAQEQRCTLWGGVGGIGSIDYSTGNAFIILLMFSCLAVYV